MGFFKSLLKYALPGIGGAIAGPAGMALGAQASGLVDFGKLSVNGLSGANAYTKGADEAGKLAMGGFNYLQGSPIGQQYLPAGGAAVAQQQALLGLGGDAAGAKGAYDNYLNSVGYRGQLASGQQAITTSRAAQGLLGSGSTAKALTRYGNQLGQESFNNYLGQLGGVAGMGLHAGGMLGQAATQGSGQAAALHYAGASDAAGARSDFWKSILGGVGAVAGAV